MVFFWKTIKHIFGSYLYGLPQVVPLLVTLREFGQPLRMEYFEVCNGLFGLMRYVILRLCGTMGGEEQKIRVVCFMCAPIY
jgi:hypothetical protein